MKIKTFFSSFWDIYSVAYDIIGKIDPHARMDNRVASILLKMFNGTFLDAGCGTASLIQTIISKSKHCKIFGIDVSKGMLSIASRKFRATNKVKLLHADLNAPLPFPNEFFDGIACVHVINYLSNPRQVCTEFHRILKKGGILVLVSFIKKLNFNKFMKHYRDLIREYGKKHGIKAFFLIFFFIIILACNLPIKIGYGIKYYNEEKIDELMTNLNFNKIFSERTYADHSILICYEKEK